MTDIRKKVARAINDAKKFGYVSDPETFVPSEDELFIADAALSACGYDEMRTALERAASTLATAQERLEWQGYTSAASDCKEAIEIARAALKAGGS